MCVFQQLSNLLQFQRPQKLKTLKYLSNLVVLLVYRVPLVVNLRCQITS
jgi:hypothetical protein